MGATAVAFSPDGKRLLVAGAGTAVLWDPLSARAERRFGEPGEFLRWVAFSPDGKTVYTAGDDDAIKAWDLRSGKALAHLRTGGGRRLTGAALSADGKYAAAADGGETLFVWETATGNLKRSPTGGSPWKTVAFLSSSLLASGGDDWAAVWDLQKGVETARVKTAAGRALAASADGRLLAASGGNTTRLWRAHDGAAAGALIGHFDAVTSAVFSADGKKLLTGAGDRTAILWSVAKKAPLFRLGGERLEPLYTASTRLGLLTVDAGSARLWDLASGRPRRVSAGAWDSSCRFSASADARLLVWSREPGLLDARDLSVQGSSAGWTTAARAEAFALDAKGSLLAAARDAGIESLDPATGLPAGRLPSVAAAQLVLAPSGQRLVAVDGRGEISAWELPSGRRSASLRAGDSMRPSVALSPDGRLLAAAGARRVGVSETRFVLTVRSLEDGQELYNWETDSELTPLAFTADDASLWTLGEGELWRWDIGTGRKLGSATLPAGAEGPWPEALDARRGFAAARVDGQLALVSLTGGKELGRLTLTDKGWLLRAADGRVDGAGGAALWVEGLESRPLAKAPGYTPGLLAALLEPR